MHPCDYVSFADASDVLGCRRTPFYAAYGTGDEASDSLLVSGKSCLTLNAFIMIMNDSYTCTRFIVHVQAWYGALMTAL